MMVSLMAALMLQAAPQAVPVPNDLPVVAPAVVSADCGALLNSPAFCVTARMDQISPIAESYMRQLEERGWVVADGTDNRVVLVKRRENGGCDGMQMLAFYDTTKPQTAEAPAYLGFANIPGDLCANAAS